MFVFFASGLLPVSAFCGLRAEGTTCGGMVHRVTESTVAGRDWWMAEASDGPC